MNAIVNSKRMLTDTTAEIVIKVTGDYISPKPGQFIRIKCEKCLLLRPISICQYYEAEKLISLIIEARGPATEWLISLMAGAKLDISQPLGNSFKLLPDKKYLLIGGGIGVVPLFSVDQKIFDNIVGGNGPDVILCFKTKNEIILADEFDNFFDFGSKFIVATDDGSFGQKDRADKILRDFLSKPHDDYEAILTCGPKPMMAAVARIAEEFGISCQVSLEERMACGIGACKGCSVKLKSRMGTVCKDGPVFDSQEVVWDE